MDIQDVLSRLQKEKGELTSQLEDERRKVEDLQFRFEEEAITKCDMEVNIYIIIMFHRNLLSYIEMYESLNLLLHYMNNI